MPAWRIPEPETQIQCVVIRADVYERAKVLLTEFDPRLAHPAMDAVMREEWRDPKMAEYDDYESRHP
jgi:hypothetical protein